MEQQARKEPAQLEEMVTISVREHEMLVANSNELHDQKRQRELAIENAANAGQYEAKGVMRMDDAKGRGWPVENIGAHEVLVDESVRKILFFGEELAAQVGRFKGHTYEDMQALQSLLEQKYEIEAGGEKGNLSFSTYDGSMKVEIKIADLQEFGPEIEIARQLFIDCVTEWADGADAKVVAIIERAFNTDGGQYNRNELMSLLRHDFDDAKWKSAQEALLKSIRVVGTKSRIYLKKRTGVDGKWETVVISLANS